MAENKEMDDYVKLPLGSMVKLDDDIIVCIIAHDVTNLESKEEYEYAGVKAPIGFIDENEIYMFNGDAILRVYAVGRMDKAGAFTTGYNNGNAVSGYLPLGSLVKLKNIEELYVITGFCQGDSAKPDVTYDYSGVLLKTGYAGAENMGVFNKEDIEDILHVGFICDGHLELEEKISELMNK